jgi:hypothetical protein
MNDAPDPRSDAERFREIFGRFPPGVYMRERVPGEYERLIREAIETRQLPQGLIDRYKLAAERDEGYRNGVMVD